jgi:hypothetical protein
LLISIMFFNQVQTVYSPNNGWCRLQEVLTLDTEYGKLSPREQETVDAIVRAG